MCRLVSRRHEIKLVRANVVNTDASRWRTISTFIVRDMLGSDINYPMYRVPLCFQSANINTEGIISRSASHSRWVNEYTIYHTRFHHTGIWIGLTLTMVLITVVTLVYITASSWEHQVNMVRVYSVVIHPWDYFRGISKTTVNDMCYEKMWNHRIFPQWHMQLIWYLHCYLGTKPGTNCRP